MTTKIETRRAELEAMGDLNLSEFVAEIVMGWKWWRYKFGQYVDAAQENYETVTVRSIQPPDFPGERWKKWGEEAGLSLADGSERRHRLQGQGDACLVGDMPSYSTYIAAAFKVVEKLLQTPSTPFLLARDRSKDSGNWIASFSLNDALDVISGTAARAICIAAILAIESLPASKS